MANMENSMMSYVLKNLPDVWTIVPSYTKPFMTFTVSSDDHEYNIIKSLLSNDARARLVKIIRVQNPFQYGRYMLRREMVQSDYEHFVLHGVHKDDLAVALEFNCDYRRYQRQSDDVDEDSQHPMFYDSFSDLLKKTIYPISDINVLVVKILTKKPKTQCDYYIQYIVKF